METATTNHELVADELLIAVFTHFEKSKNLPFKDEGNIMTAFYKASKDPKYKVLFENYYFDEDGITPYSREISDGLDLLHQSSLLRKLNPSFCKYQLSEGVDYTFHKYIEPLLNKEQKELIKELAEEINQTLITD